MGLDEGQGQVLNLILKGIDDLRNDVAGLRSEISSGDDKRVSKDEFGQYQKATDGRLERLEASPMRLIAYCSMAVAVLSLILQHLPK